MNDLAIASSVIGFTPCNLLLVTMMILMISLYALKLMCYHNYGYEINKRELTLNLNKESIKWNVFPNYSLIARYYEIDGHYYISFADSNDRFELKTNGHGQFRTFKYLPNLVFSEEEEKDDFPEEKPLLSESGYFKYDKKSMGSMVSDSQSYCHVKEDIELKISCWKGEEGNRAFWVNTIRSNHESTQIINGWTINLKCVLNCVFTIQKENGEFQRFPVKYAKNIIHMIPLESFGLVYDDLYCRTFKIDDSKNTKLQRITLIVKIKSTIKSVTLVDDMRFYFSKKLQMYLENDKLIIQQKNIEKIELKRVNSETLKLLNPFKFKGFQLNNEPSD
eukprot:NODE_350_length_8989_cov_0.477684.p3 type:complete len:334 gc:universal NODE_350_length_8989_cov_0.477684:4682-3681(-)